MNINYVTTVTNIYNSGKIIYMCVYLYIRNISWSDLVNPWFQNKNLCSDCERHVFLNFESVSGPLIHGSNPKCMDWLGSDRF